MDSPTGSGGTAVEPIAIGMESGTFYMLLARRALQRLRAESSPLDGGLAFTYSMIQREPSPHFEAAVACTVYSAFAVEYELARLVEYRRHLVVPTSGKPLGVRLSERATRKEIRVFLRQTTKLDEALIEGIFGLFDDRDKFAHARINRWIDDEEAPIIERGMDMPRITSTDVGTAPENIKIAIRAVETLREEFRNPDWTVKFA